MQFFSTATADMEGEAFVCASPMQQLAWFKLKNYCAKHENGGRIAGASTWNSRKWTQVVGVRASDIDRGCGLWVWDGQDLVVQKYPVWIENSIRAKREGGKVGGERSAKARQQANGEANPQGNLEGMLQADPQGKLEGNPQGEPERNVREGKVMEGKGEKESSLSTQIPSLEEVRTWASMSSVHPDFAEQKWNETTERGGWVLHGQLLDWRRRWVRFWNEDREQWLAKRKQKNKELPPAGVAPEDEWLWRDDLEELEKSLIGALKRDDKAQVERIQAALKARRGW